mgnify:CR=1 FL=1|tara:strand:- start:2068 stop:2847 length:780 start_codon:yes stop_codon:yes gene_type:complete
MNTIVLGGSSGIGFSCALAFAKRSDSLLIVSRNVHKLENAYQKLKENISYNSSQTIDFLAIDLSHPDELTKITSYIQDKWQGQVDHIILNSGGPPIIKDALTIDEAMWHQHLSSMFFSFIEIIKHCVPFMKNNTYGRYVVISSSGVLKPIDGLMISNTIRTALDAWINSITKDLIEYNITINTIIPGKINTERLRDNNKKFAEVSNQELNTYVSQMQQKIPAKRFGQPDEIAHVALFLCTKETSYITGNKIKVDGGLTL